MCPNACQLYKVSKDEDKCATCGHGRFLESSDSPAATLKVMSIGDLLSRMLSDVEIRKGLRYRHERQGVPYLNTNYFDGLQYQKFRASGFFKSPDDIALAFFVDEIEPQDECKQTLTVVHTIVLNFDHVSFLLQRLKTSRSPTCYYSWRD